jgi:hypothetical protein
MLKYYHKADVNGFRFRDLKEVRNILVTCPRYFDDLTAITGGNVYTVWADEKTPVVIGGWTVSPYHNACLFMMASEELDERFNKTILKDINTVIDMPKRMYKRVESVIAENERNKRFIEFLGFKRESVLEKYDFDGSDMYMYVYIKGD